MTSAQPVSTDLVVRPFDALCAAGRDHVHAPAGAAERRRGHRRRARARARRFGRADAALPDQNAHAIGRLDQRQLDVRALREKRMHGEAGRHGVQPLVGRPVRARRTADCRRAARRPSTRSPATSSVSWRTSSGAPIAARNVVTSRRGARAASALWPGAGVDREAVAGRQVALERQPRADAPHAVARHLRDAAVRVEEPRRCARRRLVRRASGHPRRFPRWRSQTRRASDGTSATPAHVGLRGTIRKSLPYAWALMNCMLSSLFPAEREQVPAEPAAPTPAAAR